jgi:hypothetical protein
MLGNTLAADKHETGTLSGGVLMSVSQRSRNEVARLAYFLWQRRGCPFGSPEVDWCQAEEQLLRRTTAGVQNPSTAFSLGWKILPEQDFGEKAPSAFPSGTSEGERLYVHEIKWSRRDGKIQKLLVDFSPG